MGILANVLIIIMELIAFRISFKAVRWEMFIYYTELSNLATLISSIAYLLTGGNAPALRYLSASGLTMTFLITLCVLVPMGGGFKKLMLAGNGLYHHSLVPVLSLFSYVFWERHSSMFLLPVILTIIYGLTMMYLNVIDKIDGPYPFLRIRHQSRIASVLWFFSLIAIISVISYGVILVAG
ncbi:MAG: hypothetical protein IJI44_04650 [Erysipelotrichaceae bacterium]|nr:hypothetical protein [Erysipelotrichaceae bacterium]